MKRFSFVFTACMMMLAVVTSCNNGPVVDKHDPNKVVNAALQCLKDKDFKNLLKLSSGSPEHQDDLRAMTEDKFSEEIDRRGGITSYEIVETNVDNNTGTGWIKVRIVYGNGKGKVTIVDMRRNENGEWQLDF